MNKGWSFSEIAQEIIFHISNGASLNLGIGFPTRLIEYIPKEKNIMIHSENGILGVWGRPTPETVSPTLINAGKETVRIRSGASFFDSALSFGMIRGGHIDFSILGGMEVDIEGNLANWMIPGKKVTGMGGAMDLVQGSKHVFVVMKHFTKKGTSKLKRACTLPLTGKQVVHLVFTEHGVFQPKGKYFFIQKLAPNILKKDLGIDGDLLRT